MSKTAPFLEIGGRSGLRFREITACMEIVRSKIQGILNKDVIGKRKLKTIDVLMVLKTTDTLSFE